MRKRALALLLVACGGDAEPGAPERPDAAATADAPITDAALDDGTLDDAGTDAACTPVVGAAIIEHACLHVAHGPHAMVTAGSDPATVTASINAAHTHFTVTLVGATAPYHGAVVYRPTQSGELAIFVDPGLELRVTTASGQALPAVVRHGVATCAGLSRAMVVELERMVSYRVVVSAASAATMGIIIEYLGGFAPEDAWGQACP
jgi:hypothetical protein